MPRILAFCIYNNTLSYLGAKCKSWKFLLLHSIWNRSRWNWSSCLELNEQSAWKIFLRKTVLGFEFRFRFLDFQLISDLNGILSDEFLLKINYKLEIPLKMSWNMWTKACKVPNPDCLLFPTCIQKSIYLSVERIRILYVFFFNLRFASTCMIVQFK